MGIAPQNQRKRLGTIEILQKSDPKTLSALSSCLGTLKQSWKKQGVITSLWNEWPKIAGEQLAPHTRPISFKHGILIIGASHPQWLQALLYTRPQLLAALRANGHKVKDLRFQSFYPKEVKELESEQQIWDCHPSRFDIHGMSECDICGSPSPAGEIKLWGRCSFCKRKELFKPNRNQKES